MQTKNRRGSDVKCIRTLSAVAFSRELITNAKHLLLRQTRVIKPPDGASEKDLYGSVEVSCSESNVSDATARP